jgi:hypothetical protein
VNGWIGGISIIVIPHGLVKRRSTFTETFSEKLRHFVVNKTTMFFF